MLLAILGHTYLVCLLVNLLIHTNKNDLHEKSIMALWLIMDGTGEYYRTKSYKLGTFGPKIGNIDGHNGPKINMMEAGIYDA